MPDAKNRTTPRSGTSPPPSWTTMAPDGPRAAIVSGVTAYQDGGRMEFRRGSTSRVTAVSPITVWVLGPSSTPRVGPPAASRRWPYVRSVPGGTATARVAAPPGPVTSATGTTTAPGPAAAPAAAVDP